MGCSTCSVPWRKRRTLILRGQVDPGIPLLKQDPAKLQQILSNLLSNAIKFTPRRRKGSGKSRSGSVALDSDGNGYGRRHRARGAELVFEKFRHSGNPLTREHARHRPGAVHRSRAIQAPGRRGVTLQSELGRGSSFQIRLPLHLSEGNQIGIRPGRSRFRSACQPSDSGFRQSCGGGWCLDHGQWRRLDTGRFPFPLPTARPTLDWGFDGLYELREFSGLSVKSFSYFLA